MNRFLLVTHEERDAGSAFAAQIKQYIESRGGESEIIVMNRREWSRDWIRDQLKDKKPFDYAIVLGGDGTFVRCSRDMADMKIPVIGANLGNLGYLCELEPDQVPDAVDRIMSGCYEVEKRLMIKGRKNQEHFRKRALNDIVIHRSERSQLIRLKITVNGEYLLTINADGVIVSTPTGSTSYNLSAGGPIVDPKAEIILITPLCAHGLHNQSIAVGADSNIVVELEARHSGDREKATISFDGEYGPYLEDGDRIEIIRSTKNIRTLKLDNLSFVQILRKKMRE